MLVHLVSKFKVATCSWGVGAGQVGRVDAGRILNADGEQRFAKEWRDDEERGLARAQGRAGCTPSREQPRVPEQELCTAQNAHRVILIRPWIGQAGSGEQYFLCGTAAPGTIRHERLHLLLTVAQG